VDSITVLQRQDWWKGKLLYKREKKTQNQGGRKRNPKKQSKNREQKYRAKKNRTLETENE
jgi:hypothetical protein